MERKNEVETVRIAYHSLGGGGSFYFILEFLLDFRKDNLVIFVIRFLFPYQGLVLPFRGLMFLSV